MNLDRRGTVDCRTACSPPDARGSPKDWSSTLLKDLDAADAALRGSHPGVVDRHNRGFVAQLDDALALARSRAARVNSFAGYWWAMKGYTASFNDGHVSLNAFAGAPELPTQWPGFLTGFDGDAQVVMSVDGDPRHPPLGARLLSCDGVDAQRLAARRAGDFNGRWNLQASRIQTGGEVLLEQANPFLPTPRICVFRMAGPMLPVARRAWTHWICGSGWAPPRQASRPRPTASTWMSGHNGYLAGWPGFRCR
ncbi:hypothetical protein [uncultured Stenotrophomonas sp.]|uniref:hypothetical protein n=1 Tax=uncultured Stenotrophomonas sp. TaxID=165438 RepID=UPI0025D18011|nr:hypothetical protein [uncultured Stenotrophomonas sp.]